MHTSAGMQGARKCILAFPHVCILAVLHVCIPAVLLSGCVRAHARTEPEPPPLDMPAPPPRNVEDRAPEAPPPVSLVEEPASTLPAPPRPAPTAQQRADPAKAEPPRVEPAVPVEVIKPAEDSRSQPATTLQTTPAEREALVEKGTRDLLARARVDLSHIDYSRLKLDARIQYDQIRRFISQAEDALLKRNLVFANSLAEKASTLAAQLAGR
jgi:hypothetical protein